MNDGWGVHYAVNKGNWGVLIHDKRFYYKGCLFTMGNPLGQLTGSIEGPLESIDNNKK